MALPLRSLLMLVALFAPALSLLVQPRVAMPSVRAARAVGPSMQFGGNKDEPKGLSRDDEPEEFFKSSFDDLSDGEKLKEPAIIGGLIVIVAPFIVGAIALAFYR